MGLANILDKVASIAKRLAKIADTVQTHVANGSTFFETELVVTEKALNLAIDLSLRPNNEIQKLSLKLHDNYSELNFQIKSSFGKPVYCRLPIHFSQLTVHENESVVVVEKAGKLSVGSESLWLLFYYQFFQAYLNSRRGERSLFGSLSKSVEFLQYEPSFEFCGKAVRPASLILRIDKILNQQQVASFLMRYGIFKVAGISGIREEEGQFVITILVGSRNDTTRDWKKGKMSDSFF